MNAILRPIRKLLTETERIHSRDGAQFLKETKVMAHYELLVLVDSQGVDVAGVLEGMKKLVTKHQGKIIEVDDWGERSLAYQIKGHDRGHYCVYQVELNPDRVKRFMNQLKIETGILRVLLTKKASS